MRFFHEEGQPAVRAAAVVSIDKGLIVGKRNYPTIEFQVDLADPVEWKYGSEEERDQAFADVLLGRKIRKIP